MSPEKLFLFLRAVNLGRVNKVPMKQLMAGVETAGLGSCSYLLQSGNLIFEDPPVADAELKRAVERLILERFQVETAAVARTPSQLRALVDENPFEAPEGGAVHVAMWDEDANEAGLEELASGDYGADALHLTERAAIIRYAVGSHNAKLGNALIERRLKVRSTARNIRTIERLLAL